MPTPTESSAPADAAEGLLWSVFGHQTAFQLGSAALAVVRLEGDEEDADPQNSMAGAMADALVAEVGRIRQALDAGRRGAEKPSQFPAELVALELFGSYQPVALCPLYEKYGAERLLEAHLWMFLAAQAASNGEVDIDARLEPYRPLTPDWRRQSRRCRRRSRPGGRSRVTRRARLLSAAARRRAARGPAVRHEKSGSVRKAGPQAERPTAPLLTRPS